MSSDSVHLNCNFGKPKPKYNPVRIPGLGSNLLPKFKFYGLGQKTQNYSQFKQPYPTNPCLVSVGLCMTEKKLNVNRVVVDKCCFGNWTLFGRA